MLHLPTLTPLEHTGFVAAGLLTYIIVTRARHQRRHPYAALAWVMSIAAFPYLGVPIFLVFGTRKLVRPATRRVPLPQGPWAQHAPAWATRLLAALGVAGAEPSADIAFQADGEASLAAAQAMMRQASRTLDVCTYVLGDDEVGSAMAAIMVERARAGVRVRLLIDAAGSLKTARAHEAMLHAAGVEQRLFMPPLGRRRRRINLRNHRKLTVADGARVWSGGRNLANEYFIGRTGEQPWLDLSFTASGTLAAQAQRLFEASWVAATGKPAVASTAPLPVPGVASAPAATPTEPHAEWPLAQWVPSGPDYHEDTLHALLLSSTFHAEQRLLLATPYFVPDEALLEALLLAVKRGVRLRLALPARSNHRLADLARGRAVRELVAAGADVRLLPRMLHAKAVVVDDVLALCGSANLDSRSFFLNYEAMVAFYDARQIGWLARWIEDTAQQGSPATARAPNWPRDLLEGVVGAVAFQL